MYKRDYKAFLMIYLSKIGKMINSVNRHAPITKLNKKDIKLNHGLHLISKEKFHTTIVFLQERRRNLKMNI